MQFPCDRGNHGGGTQGAASILAAGAEAMEAQPPDAGKREG